jgi:NAD-dependent dihydropyrimidine dehydrogenase PreA subunit
MRPFIYLKNVTTLEVMAEKCIGCGLCIDVCPHAVLGLNEAGRVWVRDKDACMECGACRRNCPTEALFVQTGVGCAAAVINAMLGREGACCCSIDSTDTSQGKSGSSCC